MAGLVAWLAGLLALIVEEIFKQNVFSEQNKILKIKYVLIAVSSLYNHRISGLVCKSHPLLQVSLLREET